VLPVFVSLIVSRINAKIKGINLIQSSLNKVVMPEEIETQIFGIDTAHPPPGSNFPTTAAVTYSIDKTGTNYRAFVRFQEPRKELVTGVGKLVQVSDGMIPRLFLTPSAGRTPSLHAGAREWYTATYYCVQVS
jgi:hypothetical protein